MNREDKGGSMRFLMVPMAALLLGGCASPPTAQLAVAEAAVEDARRADARTHAPMALQSAEEKVQGARAAIKQEDYDTARFLATEAEVDARLAEVSAQSAKDQGAAQEVQQSIQMLRQELNLPPR